MMTTKKLLLLLQRSIGDKCFMEKGKGIGKISRIEGFEIESSSAVDIT